MSFLFFFFTDPAPTEIYTLSLHDALPISAAEGMCSRGISRMCVGARGAMSRNAMTWSSEKRSEERRVGKECRVRWAERREEKEMKEAGKSDKLQHNCGYDCNVQTVKWIRI